MDGFAFVGSICRRVNGLDKLMPSPAVSGPAFKEAFQVNTPDSPAAGDQNAGQFAVLDVLFRGRARNVRQRRRFADG